MAWHRQHSDFITSHILQKAWIKKKDTDRREKNSIIPIKHKTFKIIFPEFSWNHAGGFVRSILSRAVIPKRTFTFQPDVSSTSALVTISPLLRSTVFNRSHVHHSAKSTRGIIRYCVQFVLSVYRVPLVKFVSLAASRLAPGTSQLHRMGPSKRGDQASV